MNKPFISRSENSKHYNNSTSLLSPIYSVQSVPEIQMGLFANPLNSFISKCQMMQIPHGLALLDLLIFCKLNFPVNLKIEYRMLFFCISTFQSLLAWCSQISYTFLPAFT